MAEQHVKIFTALGLPQEAITAIEGLTPDKLEGFTPDEYVNQVSGVFKNKFINDGDFLNSIPQDKLPNTVIKGIESGQYNRFLNEVGEVAKKDYGVDISTLPQDTQKSLKGMVRAVFQESLKKSANPETVQKLQGELSNALAELETTKGGIPTAIEQAVSKEKNALVGKLERMATINQLRGIEGLTVEPDFAMPAVDMLKTKYTVLFNPETFEFSLAQKDNPQLKVLKADGKELSFTDALTALLTDKKLIAPKAGGEEGKNGKGKRTTVLVEGDKTDANIPDYIKRKATGTLAAEGAQ